MSSAKTLQDAADVLFVYIRGAEGGRGANYAAALNTDVGRALADWLEATAKRGCAVTNGYCETCEAALFVARGILAAGPAERNEPEESR